MKEVCNILVKTSFKDSNMFQPIVPGRKLNLQEKGAIVALHDREISATGIAQQLGCSRNTVTKWIHRFQDTGNVNRKVGSGSIRKTLPAQDARFFMAVTAKPIKTLQELKGKVVEGFCHFFNFFNYDLLYMMVDLCNVPIHTSTIYRRL